MRRRGIRRKILWTGIDKIFVYGINLAQGVVLARLLSPSDFGLAAMLGIFLALGTLLAESGLGTALVVGLDGQKNVGQMERRALRWNVEIAGALYLVLLLISPFVARFYKLPILMPLLWVMALGMIFQAASVVAGARLTRERAFGKLATANSASVLVGGLMAICCAWVGWGVWSIAIMAVVTAFVRMCTLWLLAHGFAVSRIEPETGQGGTGDFSRLMRLGLKLMMSGVIHAVYSESYNLVIGKMWSPAAVGLFSRSSRWARLPGEIVNEGVGRVALPYLTCGSPDERRRFLIIACALLWPGLILLGLFAPEVVGLVFGAKWLDCVPYVRILIVGQFFTSLSNIALQQIRASGCGDALLRTDAVKKPVGIVALICGVPFGVTGLCWARVVDDVVEAVVDIVQMRRLTRETQERLA